MSDEQNGRTAASTRPARDEQESQGASTLLPMLIVGLVLITVGMTVVALLV